MFNIGIVGCGKMGRVHAEVFPKNELCRIKGLYNRTKEKAIEIQRSHPDAKVYDSWQELIADKDIDIIAISTPQNQRLEQYTLAIEHGKHVFIEKPLALGLEDFKKTLNLLKNSNSCFYVDSNLRSHPVIIAVNKVIDKIGEIFHIDIEVSMYREEIKWKHKLSAGGGVIRELGGHMIDQAANWLGEAKSVVGYNKVVLPGREVEDFSVNIIEYKNGATLQLNANYFERNGRLQRGRIFGTKGQIDFTFSSYDVLDSKVTLHIGEDKTPVCIDIPDKSGINSVYPGLMDSFKKEINNFINCIVNRDKASDIILKEWKTSQILSASYESSRLGKKIYLPFEDFDISKLKKCYFHY